MGVQSDAQTIIDDLMSRYETGNRNKAYYKETLSKYHDDLLDSGENTGFLKDDNMAAVSMEDIDALIAALAYGKVAGVANQKRANAFQSELEIKDGFAAGSGSAMTTSAAKVVPIHDGSVQLAKSDPRDSAIFAKTGGPFDTLFNDVFGRINDVYATLEPISAGVEAPRAPSLNIENIGSPTQTSSSNTNSPIDVNIHGDLRLISDGQTINISKLIESDPLFVRKITSFVLNQIDSNVNGGKSRMWLDQPHLSYSK